MIWRNFFSVTVNFCNFHSVRTCPEMHYFLEMTVFYSRANSVQYYLLISRNFLQVYFAAVFQPYFRNFNTFSHIPCSPRYDTVFILEKKWCIVEREPFQRLIYITVANAFCQKKKKRKKKEKKTLCLLMSTAGNDPGQCSLFWRRFETSE